MNNRYRKVKYHCTYVIEGVDGVSHYYSNRIYKVRNFIRANRKNVISCWKTTLTKNINKTERIYRLRLSDEPKDFHNNFIGA